MSATNDIPPFEGYVQTTTNALRLIHAARQGVIPRITRRLNDHERRTMIKSGSVFVFSVEESGIRRWTDGRLWSPSRIVGNFLVYREINERTGTRSPGQKKIYPIDEPASSSSSSSSSRYANPDIPTFKAGGLHKKTITVTIEGSDLHLISYYTNEDIRSGALKRPTARSDIMDLRLSPHMFRLANFRIPPKMEIGPDGKSQIAPEPEDLQENEHATVKAESQSPEYTGGSPSSSSSESYSPVHEYPLSSAAGHELQYPSSSSSSSRTITSPSYTASRDRSFSLSDTPAPVNAYASTPRASMQRRETISTAPSYYHTPSSNTSSLFASYEPYSASASPVKVEENAPSSSHGLYNPSSQQQQYSSRSIRGGYSDAVPRSSGSSHHGRGYNGHPYAGYASGQWQQQMQYKYDAVPSPASEYGGGGGGGYYA